MGYFVKVVDNVVVDSIVADKEWIEKDFVDNSPGRWIETFQDGTNGAYAGKGFIWDDEMEAFYLPQPFPSWSLNKDKWIWEAPITKPSDETIDKRYVWDEDVYKADNTKGWIVATE